MKTELSTPFGFKFQVIVRIFIIAIIALVTSVLVSIVFKILFINNTWVYLNLLIEPIWFVLLIALFGSLYTKFIFKN